MTSVTTLGQDCMPVVAADPLSLRGSITLTNTGTVPIGPVTLSAGQVLDLATARPLTPCASRPTSSTPPSLR